jgi:hypothetical protein
MKSLLLTAAVLSAALSLRADPKSDLQAAAKKLSEAPNYTWTSKTEIQGGQFTPPTITGKAEKGGFAVLTSEREGNVTTAVQHGTAGTVKTDDGWKTADELSQAAGGGGGGRGMRGGNLLRTRRPDAELATLADKVKELKAVDGSIGGDLTEESVKEWMTFGRGGQNAPKNAKGSVKVWLKEGSVAKVEVKTSGTINRNGEDVDMASTRTVEIKEVGTTKVEVPDDAKKKLGK